MLELGLGTDVWLGTGAAKAVPIADGWAPAPPATADGADRVPPLELTPVSVAAITPATITSRIPTCHRPRRLRSRARQPDCCERSPDSSGTAPFGVGRYAPTCALIA